MNNFLLDCIERLEECVGASREARFKHVECSAKMTGTLYYHSEVHLMETWINLVVESNIIAGTEPQFGH